MRMMLVMMVMIYMIVMISMIVMMMMIFQAGDGSGWDEDHQDSSWRLAQCGYIR